VPSGRSLAASFDRKTGEYIAKPEPGWRGDAGGQIGGTQAFLADDQIYAVGEHHILALDQEKQKSGFGWFAGTQMTLAGDMGYMANGNDDQSPWTASSTRKARASVTATKWPSPRSPRICASIRPSPKRRNSKPLKPPHARQRRSSLAKAQAELAAIAPNTSRCVPPTKRSRTRSRSTRPISPAAADVGVKWTLESPHQSALIVAGKTLIAGGKDEVIVIDTETGKLACQTGGGWRSTRFGRFRRSSRRQHDDRPCLCLW
jgi:hypothetical protein